MNRGLDTVEITISILNSYTLSNILICPGNIKV